MDTISTTPPGATATDRPIAFDNSYARLPERFFARTAPNPVAAPRLIRLNHALARQMGLDADFLASPRGVAMLAGNHFPDGADPVAMAYAGHQFGHFVPQLGDGRAMLLGEVVGTDGIRRDIHLKGAGRTPFSRGGDGRAALGPVLREYLVSEAMAALGIPTTRALAAVASGEWVMREQPQPGAVLARVAQSHVRVGTFQYSRGRDDIDGLRALADYVISRHYPHAAGAPQPYCALLEGVISRTARLVAGWLMIGFIHGVMNTDNTSVAGETIDYGPCAFMDAFHPGTVFSSIDAGGRYAYGNQPRIAAWNLARLAEAMLPLLADGTEAAVAAAEAALEGFAPVFEAAYGAGLRAKLGLATEQSDDLALANALLAAMADNQADFTLVFRLLADAAADPAADAPLRALFADPAAYDGWAVRWRARLALDPATQADRRAAMRRVNPAFIPRNHRIEAVIAAAVSDHDFAPFEALLAVLIRPYEDQPEAAGYADPPLPDQVVRQTFCGT